MTFKRLRTNRTRRIIAALLNLLFLSEIITPTAMFALNSGTTQPEFVGMASGNTTDLVNTATGDFSYNLPLLNIDGYPLNLTYSSGVRMDQEATWVGLGWNLNPGTIQRNVRGLPDDFKGDKVSYEKSMKDQETIGVNSSFSAEFAGFSKNGAKTGNHTSKGKGPKFGAGNNFGILWDSYKGIGLISGWSTSASIGDKISPSIGLDLSTNSHEGINVTPNAGLSFKQNTSGNEFARLGVNIGTTISSSEGIKGYNVGANLSVGETDKIQYNDKGETEDVSSNSGVSSSSYIPVGNVSYTPYSPYVRDIESYSFDIGIGAEVNNINYKGTLKGSYIKQSIRDKAWNNSSYGYVYSENAGEGDLLDFNRDKDGLFYEGTPRLPFAAMMYDTYSANAPGLSQAFRPYRNDLGVSHDPLIIESSSNNAYSAEVGFANLVKVGANVANVSYDNTRGGWDVNASLIEKFRFKKKKDVSKKDYKTFYFKAAGDNSHYDNNLINNQLGEDKAIAPNQSDYSKYTTNAGGSTSFDMTKKQNEKKNNTNFTISHLSAEEASHFGLEKKIRNYNTTKFDANSNSSQPLEISGQVYTDYGVIDRDDNGYRKSHHFSELSVTNDKGQRYVYGLPVYNIKQREVSFSVDYTKENFNDGLVTYAVGDNSTANSKERSSSFDAKEVPAHASSYLLTALLSPDYVDITGDGPTPDDLGKYTKFNYSKNEDNLQWRDPYFRLKAKYNPISYFVKDDDMGSYTYGEKEIWVLHSIETKNYVAEFELADRKDGRGVPDENGGLPTNLGATLKHLKTIKLYTRQDKILQGKNSSYEPTPVKSVHFEYDYTLCGNVPNNDGSTENDINYNHQIYGNNRNGNKGKLTLKKVYYTYGNSTIRSQYSNYSFNYGSDNKASNPDVVNPGYSSYNIDRWGNYKEQSVSGTFNGKKGNPLANFEYTFSEQDQVKADREARAWNLTSIKMPSGSIMKVEYESDRYSYVQDRKSMKMFRVLAFRNHLTGSNEATLYDRNDLDDNNYIVISIPDDPSISALPIHSRTDYVKRVYLKDVENMFFKMFLKLRREIAESFDFVTGYAEIDKNDMTVEYVSGDDYKLIVRLQDLHLKKNKGKKLNPIAIACFQYARSFLNYDIRSNAKNNASGFSGEIAAFFKQFTEDIKAIFRGQNIAWAKDGVGEEFDSIRSFVRLNHSGDKFGGGHRVKKIVVEDGWKIGFEDEITTGQQFEYTLKEGGTSGVANNEPLIGGEENPLREPTPYTFKRSYTNNDYLYMEEPFAHFLYPNAQVVYSRVKSFALDYYGVTEGVPGFSITEYFTSKDFPVKDDKVKIETATYRTPWYESLFKMKSENSLTQTQGFALKLNDMHGKLKSIATHGYSESSSDEPFIISKKTYNYRSSDKTLISTAPSMNSGGELKNTQGSNLVFGKEVDVLLDTRFSHTKTEDLSISANFDISLYSAVSIPTFSIFLYKNTDEKTFENASINKVIMQYGILESVTSEDMTYSKTVKNEYLDERTGAPVLTGSKNRYEDDTYSFIYPSHLVYEGMGNASDNNCVVLTETFLNEFVMTTGVIAPASKGIFFPGDEVIVKNDLAGTPTWDVKKYWVVLGYLEAPQVCTQRMYLVDRSGKLIEDAGTLREFKIVRSGRRNHLSAKLGGYSRLASTPATGSKIYNASNANYTNILSGSAEEYSERWSGYGSLETNTASCTWSPAAPCQSSIYDGRIVNPYIKGVLGNWRPSASHVYYNERNQNSKTTAHAFKDLDEQGTYTMAPFFLNSTGLLYDKQFAPLSSCNLPSCKWLASSTVTSYSPEGVGEEVVDAATSYSSVLMGYNNTLIKAKASLARKSEIVSENFEDKNASLSYSNEMELSYSSDPNRKVLSCADCRDIHYEMDWSKVSQDFAHTGRFSFKLAGNTVEPTRQIVNIGSLVWDPTDASNVNIFDPCSLGVAYQYYNWANIKGFSPTTYSSTEKSYMISVWIKQGSVPYNSSTNSIVTTYNNFDIDISSCGSLTSTQIASKKELVKSKIIDGWQKFDLRFTMNNVPAGPENYLEIKFKNTASEVIYMDDLRIQPYTAVMQTTVYDPVNYRKVADLDENNFAILYKYDSEGQLTNILRETQNGIVSVSESRQSIVKTN